MIETPALEIVLRESGAERRLLVDSDSARVGSGPFCEVRLRPEDAAPEQLRLQARGERVYATAVAAAPPVFLDGAPLSRGRLAPGAELRVGTAALRVRVVERHPSARASAPRRALGRVLYALGGVGIPLGILLSGPRTPPDAWELPAEPQRLWAALPAAPACPGGTQGVGRALGDDLMAQAQLALERAPFSPRDGVHAVELSLRAAACYASADADADQARAAAERARAQLEREFHVHQVRLERALQARDRERTRREIRLLLSFVAGRPSAYADWLVLLERQLDLQLAKEKP